MNKSTLSLLLVLFTSSVFAQTADNTITYRKVFGGYKFEQNGQALSPKSMLDIFQGNEEAYQAMRKAKSNYDPAMVLSVIGGALVGWPLGTAVGGGDPNWALAAIGGACIIGSIPLGSAFNRHAIRATDLYNGKDFTPASAQLYFGPTHDGLGLTLKL